MRVVIAIKSTGGRGAARAARYISERDRDPEREGESPRLLFSEYEEKLTYRKANQSLSNGHGTPDKDDLIHFSTSFLPEDYEQLGENDKERKERLREVAREALSELKDELNASEWRWVAGIHLNTEHPHLHILISKEISNRDTGGIRRLGRIPKRLLPHRESTPEGTTVPVEGKIGKYFIAALDRHIERTREIAELHRSSNRSSAPATFTKLVIEQSAPLRDVSFNNKPLVRVSRRHPCPVCNKPSWCSTSPDRTLVICMRVQSPHETRNGGYVHILNESFDKTNLSIPRLVEVVQTERADIQQRDVVYRALLESLSLNERDKTNLMARGLDEATIEQNGYRSLPSPLQTAETVRRLDQSLLAGVPGFYREDGKWLLNIDDWHQGFLVPVKDESGRIEGFQIRRIQSEPRYVWLSSKNKTQGTSSGAPVHFCNASRIKEQGEVIITEGALKADIIGHYLDRSVISVQGVMSFPAEFGQQLKEKFPELRQVNIAFDADSKRKPEVQRAIERLELVLEQAGFKVAVLKWQERDGKGLDDYLQTKLGDNFTQASWSEGNAEPFQVLQEIGWVSLTKGVGVAIAVADERKDSIKVLKLDETIKKGQWLRTTSDAHNVSTSWDGYSKPDSVDNSFTQPPASLEHLSDRLLLGEAIVADVRHEIALLSYEKAVKGGEGFRFQVRDESTGEVRQISEMDVKRHADARGQRTADENNLHSARERRELQQQVSQQDIAKHTDTLQALSNIRNKVVAKLAKELEVAQRKYALTEPRATTVIQKYQSRGEELPAPLISRDALVELQDRAINNGLAERVTTLEQLRVALSQEHNQPLRKDGEAGRLIAQLFIAQSEVSAKRERASAFDQSKHLQRWEIGKERWSLVDLDRVIAIKKDEARFFGKYNLHLDSNVRRQASDEASRLTQIRTEVVERIQERNNLLHNEMRQAQKLTEVLTNIYQIERDSYAQKGQALPEPKFTGEEIERIASNAETTRDTQLLRQLYEYEKRFEQRGETPDIKKSECLLQRLMAREITAEINLNKSSERLKNYEERRDIQPLAIADKEGNITIHTLKEAELHSVIQRMLRPFIERTADREHRGNIKTASVEYHQKLVSDFQKSRDYYQAAREITAEVRNEIHSQEGLEKILQPVFTAKERINLEIYAERQTDALERERYLNLAHPGSVEQHHQEHDVHLAHSQERSNENVLAVVRSFFTHGSARGR